MFGLQKRKRKMRQFSSMLWALPSFFLPERRRSAGKVGAEFSVPVVKRSNFIFYQDPSWLLKTGKNYCFRTTQLSGLGLVDLMVWRLRAGSPWEDVELQHSLSSTGKYWIIKAHLTLTCLQSWKPILCLEDPYWPFSSVFYQGLSIHSKPLNRLQCRAV